MDPLEGYSSLSRLMDHIASLLIASLNLLKSGTTTLDNRELVIRTAIRDINCPWWINIPYTFKFKDHNFQQ